MDANFYDGSFFVDTKRYTTDSSPVRCTYVGDGGDLFDGGQIGH